MLKIILCFAFLFRSYNSAETTSKVYRPEGLTLTDCPTETTPAPIEASFAANLDCIAKEKKILLGSTTNANDITILKVDSEESTLGEAVCKPAASSSGGSSTGQASSVSSLGIVASGKASGGSSTTKVHIKIKTDKTKSVLFKETTNYKVLLIGATDTQCFSHYLVQDAEIKKRFVHVDYIKCFPAKQLDAFVKANPTKTNYLSAKDHVCFIREMLLAPICVNVVQDKSSSTVIISPYPSVPADCKTQTKSCENVQQTTPNSNQTAQSSGASAKIVISVVSVVVVIIIGGVGFYMMKK